MKTNTGTWSEFEKFDAVVGKILSVSHKGLQEREKIPEATQTEKAGQCLACLPRS
jgi:hypothetical protein